MPVLNPLSLKAAIDTGGRSAVRGLRRMLRDLASPPRVPSMVEPDAFTVGEDLAATPGAVVFRTDVFELIQYRPTTETVRAVPLLMVPPTINKFYIADLAPGRSIVEHYLSAGQQVFMISWRNPDERHAAWDLDTYGQAIIDAMDAVERATGSEQVALQAFCSGGIITAMCWPTWPRPGGRTGWRGLSLAVTVLDWARAGTVSALMDEASVKAATEKSRKKGYLDGAPLAEVFAWLRPNDLVWNYWVNNYLQGKPPPNFDILYWNADTTRMSAGLHRDFIDIAHRQRADRARQGHDARHAGRPVHGHRRLLRHRRDRRPPLPVAGLLPQHPAARRGQPVRPVHQRAHRLAGQPAGQPEVHLPGRGIEPGRIAEEWLDAGRDRAGLLVAGLRLARRALRRRDPGARRRRAARDFTELGTAPGSYVLDR